MFVYCDLDGRLYDDKNSVTEFEVLNELKDMRNRYDSNCKCHTRFLFEFDDKTLDEQKAILEKYKSYIRRATFSGSKSIHIILEFDKKYEDFCSQNYKNVWNVLNECFFEGKADVHCSNPARLTRRPGGFRSTSDGYVEQTLLYESDKLLNMSDKMRQTVINRTVVPNIIHADKPAIRDGLCRHYDVIVHYLNTSYPLLKGNGDSSISLFKAIRCCLKYGDNRTLYEVLEKARREHWSEKELERIQTQVRDKYI